MKLLPKFLALTSLALFCGPLWPQVQAVATIQIQVLNAKTGRPVVHEGVNVEFKGVRGVPAFQSDDHGMVTVIVKPGDQVRVVTNWWVTCQDLYHGEAGYIPVKSIVEQGFVLKNTCGRTRTESVPGRITIFARKRTFLEGMKS